MNDTFQQLLDANPKWSKATRAAVAALGEQQRAEPATVAYLPGAETAPVGAARVCAPIAPARPEAPDPIVPAQWITKCELASRMGLSTKTIDRYVLQGMPCGQARGRGAVRFQAGACIAWRNARPCSSR